MPLRDIGHAISSAQSNELIEWQTGKLFAYLTLRNLHINVTFRAFSHEPGTVAPGQVLPRVHMMICCPGASSSSSDHI